MTRRSLHPSRRPTGRTAALLLGAAALLSACEYSEAEKQALHESTQADVISESELNDVMLTLADSSSAVEYYRRALGRDPENAELKRGFAISLARDKQNAEARNVFEEIMQAESLVPEDRVLYARVLARLEDWNAAETALDALPAGYATASERVLRGVIADHHGDWIAADVAYQEALRMTAQPASIHNNIGVSMMARGDLDAAGAAFREALTNDPNLFAAKNNLGLSFALKKEYRLPTVTMSEEERALILHNMAMVALRQGDREVAVSLLERAVAIHPRHWPPAADKLETLRKEGKS